MDIEKRVMEKMDSVVMVAKQSADLDFGRLPGWKDFVYPLIRELVILEAKCENLLYLVGELMGPEIFPVWPEDIRGMERKKNG